MKKLYLHIGTPKTGTTSIQQYLQEMQDSKILFQNNFQFHSKNLFSIFQQCLVFNNDSNYIYTMLSKELNLYNQNNADFKDNIIFSAENFSFTNINIIQNVPHTFASIFHSFFKNYDVKIIIYLRRQDSFFESLKAQAIKEGRLSGDLLKFRNGIMDKNSYTNIINSYAGLFGKENIIVRVYDKELLFESDVVSDFLKIVGLEHLSKLKLERKHENLSLSPEALRIRLAYNNANNASEKIRQNYLVALEKEYKSGCIDKPTYAQKKIISALVNNSGKLQPWEQFRDLLLLANSGSFSNTGFMQPDERREFLAQYEEDNAAIAREYFGREDGKLFNDKFPENIVSLDEPSTTDIVTVFLPIFQHLHERIEHLERQVANTQNTQHTKNIETRLNTIERRLGYIKAPWKVLPVIVRRICKKFNLQEKTPALYAFMRSVYRKCNFWK